MDTEGNINVLWSDRTRSALPPQNLFVVHIDVSVYQYIFLVNLILFVG